MAPIDWRGVDLKGCDCSNARGVADYRWGECNEVAVTCQSGRDVHFGQCAAGLAQAAGVRPSQRPRVEGWLRPCHFVATPARCTSLS